MTNAELISEIKSAIQTEIRGALGAEISKLNEVFGQLKTDIVEFMDSKIEEKVKGATKNLNDNVSKLESKNVLLEEKIEKWEVQTNEDRKRKNILIYGLGTLSDWREREVAVFTMIRDKIGVTCREEDIDSILKLDKNRDDGPLLVKFTTMRKKLEVISHRRNLKDTKIYLDEDYSKDIVEKRKALKKIMKKFKDEGKQTYMKRDKLWVEGELWTNDEQYDKEEENDDQGDIEMGMSSSQTNQATNKKRSRSPSDAILADKPRGRPKNQTREAVNQRKINSFFNKSLERPRSSSVGTVGSEVGPEIAKLVDKLYTKKNHSKAAAENTQIMAETTITTMGAADKQDTSETTGNKGTEEA